MNLAKVRSAIVVTIALVCLLDTGAAQGDVTIALVPRGTGVDRLARLGMAPGLLSAGLGSVPARQTYLDVSQGNRVFDSLYDEGLPRRVGGGMCGPGYSTAVIERAESAPADIEPGLLAKTLAAAGARCEVRSLSLGGLAALVGGLRGDDLAIAIERAPPAEDEQLAIGIAGRGFRGDLTSDSTRTDGYVLSTDVAPTVLGRFGIAVPDAMSGRAIRAEGDVDVAAIEARGARMAVISERRGPVIGISLMVWLVGLLIAIVGGAPRRGAVKVVALAVVYLPLVLLLAAAFEPGERTELLLTTIGAPALAILSVAALPGYRAVAVASAAVAIAYAVDAIAGSPLTSLSLLGPNPGLGVRFYGIGNELEAILVVLTAVGTGAVLVWFASCSAPATGVVAFLAVSFLFAAIFAAGAWGADVGAAIVFPLGGAVAAAALASRRGGGAPRVLAVLAAPLTLLALVALADLVTGADAHLTRSVLDAGGLGDLAEVAQRRLQLSAHSFARPVVLLFLPLVAALGLLALARRDRIEAWLAEVPPVRAGLLGALAAIAVGTLANDSGALLLIIGAAYIAAFLAFAWAERPIAGAGPRAEPRARLDPRPRRSRTGG